MPALVHNALERLTMASRNSTMDLSYFYFERRLRDRLAEAHILEDTRQEALEQGLAKGMTQGRTQGLAQGLAQGRDEMLRLLGEMHADGLLTEAQYQARKSALTPLEGG